VIVVCAVVGLGLVVGLAVLEVLKPGDERRRDTNRH
jgi:hypothetical protein